MAVTILSVFLCDRLSLAAENLALRHELAILSHKAPHPKLRRRDCIFWVWLSKVGGGWISDLLIVKPKTVVRWHRQGFRLYWRWKSARGKAGSPRAVREVRDLIRQMSREKPTWCARRIQWELC